MAEEQQNAAHPARSLAVRGFSLVEDIVYIGLGILLTVSAFALLGAGFKTFFAAVTAHDLGQQFVTLLDRMLLVLLVIEVLFTVQVSFREHGLVAEPFLVIALIAVIRRILVVTAEAAHLPEASNTLFQHAMIELAVLTVMVLVMVVSLIALQRQTKNLTVTDTTNSKPVSG